MYYPIIDKLKEIMTDITSVKEKEPLIIEGTVTGADSGNWTGNYSDIASSFSNNRQVLFKLVVQNNTILAPLFGYNAAFSSSVCFPFNMGGGVVVVYGTIEPTNTFTLHVIQ